MRPPAGPRRRLLVVAGLQHVPARFLAELAVPEDAQARKPHPDSHRRYGPQCIWCADVLLAARVGPLLRHGRVTAVQIQPPLQGVPLERGEPLLHQGQPGEPGDRRWRRQVRPVAGRRSQPGPVAALQHLLERAARPAGGLCHQNARVLGIRLMRHVGGDNGRRRR